MTLYRSFVFVLAGLGGFTEVTVGTDSAHAKSFAIIGDTQRTLGVERILMGRKQNDGPRERVVNALAATKPEYVVHLGDMVDWGDSQKSWDYYYRLMEPILKDRVPVMHLLGNHEYFGMSDAQAKKKFTKVLPEVTAGSWRSVKKGNLLLVLLNSNKNRLSKTEWKTQVDWLSKTLKDADADSSVKAALVFCHHAPFSNSRLIGSDEDVQKSFVPAFHASKKAIAFFSGHVHGYEHFVKSGKHFVVSGGGGGPRVKYHHGKKRDHEDLFQGPEPRPFHFLSLSEQSKSLGVEMHGFYDGEDPQLLDQFTIGYP